MKILQYQRKYMEGVCVKIYIINLKIFVIYVIHICYLGAILTTSEKMGTGTVESYTYHTYVKSAGGYLVALLVFFMLLLNVGSSAFSTWWLAIWIKAGGGVNMFSFFNWYLCFLFLVYVDLFHLRMSLIPIPIKL